MRLSLRASLFLAVLFLVSVPALAQTSAEFEAAKGIDEKFRLDLGGFLQNFTTTIGRRIYTPFEVGSPKGGWDLWHQIVICSRDELLRAWTAPSTMPAGMGRSG